MPRTALPTAKVSQIDGCRVRRLATNSPNYSISPRMDPDDEHDNRWYAKPRKVTVKTYGQLVNEIERYTYELTHPEEVAAQKRAEEAREKTMREYIGDWRKRRKLLIDAGSIQMETAEREEVELRHIERYLGDLALPSITADDLVKTYAAMARDGVTEYTRYRTHAKVKRVLRQARLDGLIDANPAEDLPNDAKPKQPRVEKLKKDERRITVAEADELVSSLYRETPDGLRAAVWLARMTGMRRGEILGLRWSDIDEQNLVVRVRRQRGKKKQDKDPKTYESSRDIPIGYPVWEYLERWQSIQRAQFAEIADKQRSNGTPAAKRLKWSKDAPVCTNRDGRHWDVNNFNRSLRIFFADHGLGEFTGRTEFEAQRRNKTGEKVRYTCTRKTGYVGASLHSLRHTYATQLIANKADPKTVQALLGHSNIQTTLQLYAEAVEENMRAAVTDFTWEVFNPEDYSYPQTPEEVDTVDTMLEDVMHNGGY